MNAIHTDYDPIRSAIKELKSYVIYAAIFSASINLLMLTPIIYMLQVYDRVVSSGSMSTLTMLTLLMVALLAASGGFEWVRSRILISANIRLEDKLRDTVSRVAFKHTLLSGKADEGNLAMNDLLGLRQFVTGPGVFAFMDAPWVPIYIFVMFLFHPYFAYAAMIAAGIMVGFAILTQKATGESLEKANLLSQKANLSFIGKLRNAEVMEGMGMEANVRKKTNSLFNLASVEQSVASSKAGAITALSKSFRMIAQSLLLGLGAYLALVQEISPGMMIAGSLLLGRALAPIDLMVGTWKNFVTARNQFFRLQTNLKKLPPNPERMDLPSPSGALSVENIIVIPPGSQAACVKGIAFSLNAGEILGVIGPSAAGKTSLVRAILGVWPLRSGTVRLDGADISQWDREALGPHLGYLPQDIELFDGSIAENICRFSQPNSDKIIKAAKTSGIHEMLLRLPNGYDTIIGPNFGALSAGQRQRLGLARAIYDSPKLVILDEPNSNLDDQGERELQAAIKQVKEQGSTVIVVTHRTSILGLVDKILLMREGLVADFGERNQVLEALKNASQKIAQLAPKRS